MKVSLDRYTYELLLTYKQSSQDADKKGSKKDLIFLEDDLWLQDSVVFEWVAKLRGSWQVFLVFVYYKDPCLLIKRFIKESISEKSSRLQAHYMRRVAAKDQRGNLLVDTSSLCMCAN
jgi:hypothetical protein